MLTTRSPIPVDHTAAATRAQALFVANLSAYLTVNVMLVLVWFATRGAAEGFWPIWPIGLWSIGLVGQAWRAARLTWRAR